jgi:hypothetical protein
MGKVNPDSEGAADPELAYVALTDSEIRDLRRAVGDLHKRSLNMSRRARLVSNHSRKLPNDGVAGERRRDLLVGSGDSPTR